MQNYTTIIGIIELRLQKVGYETTQKRYGVGSSTVTLVMKRFRELGVPLEELKARPPKDVEAAFYPPENLRRTTKHQPDFFKIHARMAAMEHPNLAFLWLEYKEEHPNGYQLSQFYELYRAFLAENFGQASVIIIITTIIIISIISLTKGNLPGINSQTILWKEMK